MKTGHQRLAGGRRISSADAAPRLGCSTTAADPATQSWLSRQCDHADSNQCRCGRRRLAEHACWSAGSHHEYGQVSRMITSVPLDTHRTQPRRRPRDVEIRPALGQGIYSPASGNDGVGGVLSVATLGGPFMPLGHHQFSRRAATDSEVRASALGRVECPR